MSIVKSVEIYEQNGLLSFALCKQRVIFLEHLTFGKKIYSSYIQPR